MSALRLSVCAVLGAAGIVLGMVSPAIAAGAAPNITILQAGPDANGDPYDLTVAAQDGNGVQITTMTAHVSSASNPDVADPTMTYVSGPPADQVWAASRPIAQSALPPGTYTVTVDATDSIDGTDSGLATPGFSFAYASSLTVSASPPSVPQGPQNVTFSGTLTGSVPGGTPVGIAGAPVDLAGAASNPVAMTDANGNFSYAATGVPPGSYTFSVAASSSGAAYLGASATVILQTTTSMTVSPNPASVTEGMQTVTFNGTVNVGGNVPIYLNGSISPVTSSDASGDFTYTATNVAPGNYTFSVAGTSLYTSASAVAVVGSQVAPTKMTVNATPSFVTFGSPTVTFSGSVSATPQGGSAVGIGSGVPVYLNGSTSPVTSTTDAHGDFNYTATGITATTDYTFSVDATPLYDAASYPVLVSLDPGTTAIKVTANPPDINLATSKVTFTGTVSVTPSGSTTPAGIGSGIPVYLNGSTSPVAFTTDSNGDFSYTATGVTKAADYDFSVNPGTYFTAASESVPIGQNQVQSTLTVTPSPASVTEGSQSVTFSGTLTGVSPGGTTAVPIQNVPVDLSINGNAATQIGTTDANGDFTYTVTGIGQQTLYDFSVASSATYTQATDDITVPVDQAQTRISNIDVTPPHLKYGQNATLKATVQYLNGQTWTPLPGVAVHLTEGTTKLPTVTTASNGTFTATLPSTHGPGWTAVVDAASLTLQATATGNLTIALPLKFVSFSARLGANEKITATGCLEVIAAERASGPGTFVAIQYSSGGRGPWRSLGTLSLANSDNPVHRSRDCRSEDQSYFNGTLPAKLANAYYRAHFAATDSFQSKASSAVHAWKYPTRVVSFTANKHTVSKNGIVRFKGRLEAKVKSWRGYGRQRIAILEYSSHLATVKTNSRGYFTAWIGGQTGNFTVVIYAMYPGNATHLHCLSNGITVRISNGAGDVAAGPAGSTGSEPVPPSISQLERLPAPAVPMLPEFTPWPSIASLARIES